MQIKPSKQEVTGTIFGLTRGVFLASYLSQYCVSIRHRVLDD